MAGAVGEALSCKDGAKGGDQDLIALQDIFGRSKEFIGAAKQQVRACESRSGEPRQHTYLISTCVANFPIRNVAAADFDAGSNVMNTTFLRR